MAVENAASLVITALRRMFKGQEFKAILHAESEASMGFMRMPLLRPCATGGKGVRIDSLSSLKRSLISSWEICLAFLFPRTLEEV